MFWSLTPRQTHRCFMAFERRQIREHNERAWAVHTAAALSRCDPKKFPHLRKLQVADGRRSRQQSAEEMLSIIRMMNAAVGGAVVKVESVH
jgi:hypothetical protein